MGIIVAVIASFNHPVEKSITTMSQSASLGASITIVFIAIVARLEALLTFDQVLSMKPVTATSELTVRDASILIGVIAVIAFLDLSKE